MRFYFAIIVIIFSPHYTVDPVDGVWGDWTSYSNCDVTCGDGMMTRTRSCDNPSPRNGGQPCPGGNSETIPCSEQPCASEFMFIIIHISLLCVLLYVCMDKIIALICYQLKVAQH